MVENTTENFDSHTTIIEATKSSQQLPPQSSPKVLQRTRHREIDVITPEILSVESTRFLGSLL
jgi:hypothetical protein